MRKLLNILIIIAIGVGFAYFQQSVTSDTKDDGKRNLVTELVAKYLPSDADELAAWYDNHIVYADNPTDNAIRFKLDDTEIQLNAHETKKFIINQGQHSIQLSDGKTMTFEQPEKSNRSILNPTGSTYLLWATNYGDATAKLKTEEITINGTIYQGPFHAVNDIFLLRQGNEPWRFGLDEPIAESISLGRGQSGVLIFNKIFRTSDFIKQQPVLNH